MDKATIVFKKLAFDLSTAKGAKKLYDTFTKHLVKSNVKHQGKENTLIKIKNILVNDARNLVKQTQPAEQLAHKKRFKDAVEQTKKNMKEFPKLFFPKK